MPNPCRERVNNARPDTLVRAARAGNNDAWARLIARYEGRVRTIARSYRLQRSDVDEVAQITFIRLYQHFDRLREPAAIAGWLSTTARREAMRILQTHVREQLTDDPQLGDAAETDRGLANLLAAENRSVLSQAIGTLSGRQRELMNLVATHPDADYEHISAILQMPMGSIGPTRARALARLRHDQKLQGHRLDGA